MEVSSLAAVELLYRSQRPPLACFIEADEGFPSLARVKAIAPGSCAIPLVFPAYNPANRNNAPNTLFGEACECSILLCSAPLRRQLEDGLARPLQTDRPNRIEADLADRLAQGLDPRVMAVQAERAAESVAPPMAVDVPVSAPFQALARRLKHRLLSR